MLLFGLWFCFKKRNPSGSKASDIQEDLSSTNIPFDTVAIQNYPVKSTDFLCKFPEYQQQEIKKSSESVSVINLNSSGCEIHINDLFEVKTHCKLKQQSRQFGEPSSARDVSMQALNLETGDYRAALESMMASPNRQLPCTCDVAITPETRHPVIPQNVAGKDGFLYVLCIFLLTYYYVRWCDVI